MQVYDRNFALPGHSALFLEEHLLVVCKVVVWLLEELLSTSVGHPKQGEGILDSYGTQSIACVILPTGMQTIFIVNAKFLVFVPFSSVWEPKFTTVW